MIVSIGLGLLALLFAPPAPGAGYVITRYVPQAAAGEMQLMPWDRVTYYAGAVGEPGLVYFDGLVNPGMWMQGQGQWYRVSAEGEAALRRLVLRHSPIGAGAAELLTSLDSLLARILSLGA